MNTGLHLKEKDCYRLIHVILLLSIFLFGTGNRLGIDSPGLLHFLAALCIIALITGMQLMTMKGRILCLVSIIAFAFITGMIVGMQNVYAFFTSYFEWLADGSVRAEEWAVGYELLQVAYAAAFCCFLAAFLERYFYLKFAMACLLICILLFCLLTGTPFSHKGVACIFCYIAVIYAEWIQFSWKKVRNKNRKANILWVMPFMAVYLLLMIWMPAPEEPYGWQFVKDLCSQLRESFLSLSQNIMRSGEEDFDMTLSGFTENGELHEDIQGDDREVMTIWSTGSLVTNIYLTGRIYDTFDDRQWQQRNHDAEPERFLDTALTRYAVQKSGESPQNYLSRTTITLRYQNFNTAYLFAPVKAERLLKNREPCSLSWDGGSMLFPGGDRENRYGTEYDVTYYQLNTGAADFDHFLIEGWADEFETSASDADLEDLLQEGGKKAGINMTPEDLEDHVRRIYDVYSEEVILSDELQRYLDGITKYAENDVEKLRLIEAELSSYTYTQNPDKLPDAVTDASGFLDYFLLESREGYCTYFATAFTLLARAEGIPARYVQGFCVPVNGDREITVYSDMAHSWPEVYIDGIGWIPFEPTPGYTRLRYTPWQTEKAESESSAPAATVSHHDIGYIEETETIEGSSSQTGLEMTGKRTNIRNILKIIFYTVLTVLAISFMLLSLEYAIRKQRYKRMTPFRKFRAEVSGNLRLLSWLGLHRDACETLQEFRERAGRTLGSNETDVLMPGSNEPDVQPLGFIENYEAVIYGGKEAKDEMIAAARRERALLFAILKKKKKRMYFYYKIRFSIR